MVAASGVGRITKPADFQRLLKSPPRARTLHFVLHHLAQAPSTGKLSTGVVPSGPSPVDDSVAGGCWLGLVVPKRHARRAVTRNLIKRHAREVVRLSRATLPQGMWLVRLREGFDKVAYPSAASPALSREVRLELDAAFAKAARPRASR